MLFVSSIALVSKSLLPIAFSNCFLSLLISNLIAMVQSLICGLLALQWSLNCLAFARAIVPTAPQTRSSACVTKSANPLPGASATPWSGQVSSSTYHRIKRATSSGVSIPSPTATITTSNYGQVILAGTLMSILPPQICGFVLDRDLSNSITSSLQISL